MEEAKKISKKDVKKTPFEEVRKLHFKDEMWYCVGVTNVIFSTWLLTAFPHMYWIWHCIKNTSLLVKNFFSKKSQKKHFFLLDFCYLANYLSVLYFSICILKANLLEFLRDYLDHLGPMLFRVAFSWVSGPVLCSIAAFRNSLVFHSEDNMTILAVHLGPSLAVYGMRWWHDELEKSFPNTFHLGIGKEMTQQEYFNGLFLTPVFFYWTLWNIPYFILVFFLAGNINPLYINV
jgi:hypothetical protein